MVFICTRVISVAVRCRQCFRISTVSKTWFLYLALIHCHTCSHGLSFGLYGGMQNRWIFGGTSMFLMQWNPALSFTTILNRSGLYLENSLR